MDEYVTHKYEFADINKGFDAMHVRSRSFCLFLLDQAYFRLGIVSVLSSICRELTVRCFVEKGERCSVVDECVCTRCGETDEALSP